MASIAIIAPFTPWTIAAPSGVPLQVNPLLAESSQPTAPADAPIVTVHMGDVTMKIPKSYILFPPSPGGKGPDAVSFTLLALLSDFTILNAKEFARPGWHNQILVGVYYKGYQLTGAASLREWYSFSNRAKVKSGPFGYLYFDNSGFNYLFRGSLENPTDIVSCRPIGGPLAMPSPYCERTVRIARDVIVQYSYSRTYLAKTSLLDKRIADLLNRFRISGMMEQLPPYGVAAEVA